MARRWHSRAPCLLTYAQAPSAQPPSTEPSYLTALPSRWSAAAMAANTIHSNTHSLGINYCM